jgi:hypothetical protein
MIKIITTLILIFQPFTQYSTAQTIFLDEIDGFYASYSRFNNNISNGMIINGTYSVKGIFDLGFSFNKYDKEELDNSYLAYLSINFQDEKAPIKSLGTFSLGVASVADKSGLLFGLGFSALFRLDHEYSIAPDIGGSISTFELEGGLGSYYHLEPSLSIGVILSYEKRLGNIFVRPGVNFSREVRSYLFSVGFIIKNDYEIY